jgi:hypothetical protein
VRIKNVLDANFAEEAPYVIGMNNHQGSRFSEYATGLNVVLDDMKSRNMIFYDSRTITDSVAYDIAKEKGILTGERSLFVDANLAEQTRQNIDTIALRAMYSPNYNYLMIGHPRPESVPGFFLAQSDLETSGIAMKPLSRNVHYIVETDAIPSGSSITIDGPWTSTTRDMISHECMDGDALELSGTAAGSVEFHAGLPKDGNYRVFVGNAGADNATTGARWSVNQVGGTSVTVLNQTLRRNRWRFLGTYQFTAAAPAIVTVDNSLAVDPSSVLQADAVKFVYDGPAVPAAVGDWMRY